MACRYKGRVWDNGWCNVACSYCTLTQELMCKHNHPTNADRIRGMSERELAEFMASKFTEFACTQAAESGHTMTATQISMMKEIWFRACMRWLRAPIEEEEERKDGSAQT